MHIRVLALALLAAVFVHAGRWDFLNAPLDKSATFTHYGASGQKRASDLSFNSPAIIPFGAASQPGDSLRQATSYVARNLDKGKSRFVSYPYSFTGSDGTAFPNGAVLSTPADVSATGFFQWLNSTTVNLNRAKALYDGSIAILSLDHSVTINGVQETVSYTFDAFSYCPPLNNWVGKFVECWPAADYLTYINTNSNAEPTSIVYVDQTDIQQGILFTKSGAARFSLLIIPDVNTATGFVNQLYNLLGGSSVSQIQKFVAGGGALYTGGFGALLAQKMGLLPAGSFAVNANGDPTQALKGTGLETGISGCGTPNPSDSNLEWIRDSLCFSPPSISTDPTTVGTGIIRAPVYVGSSSSVFVVANFSSEGLQMQSSLGSNFQAVSSESAYPFMLYSKYQQGEVYSNLGSSVSDPNYFPWLYNAIWTAMSRPLLVNSGLISATGVIPALEQVAIGVQINVTNLYNENLQNTSFRVFVAAGIDVVKAPTGCALVSPLPTGTSLPSPALNNTFVYDCSPQNNVFVQYTTLQLTFQLYIWNISITQAGDGIVLVYPHINYTVPSRNNEVVNYDYGAVTTSAYLAALLVTDINADPMGIYPVLGQGNNVDNVQFAQNKAQTTAYNVKQISFVPLVTPFVDGSNQAQIVHILDFDFAYYTQSVNLNGTFVYPFVHPTKPYASDPKRDMDFLDYQRFQQRNNYMVVNWDEPVTDYKIPRDTSFGDIYNSSWPNLQSIPNAGFTSNIQSYQQLLQQSFFPDADNFYTEASQRNQPYFDLTNPVSWQAYSAGLGASPFPGAVVPSWRLNSAKTAMRANLAFGRQDIYYYQYFPDQQPIPDGMTNLNYVISLDRYVPPATVTSDTTCTGPRYAVKGYYDSSITTASDHDAAPGLSPNQWTNTILDTCSNNKHIKMDITDAASLPAGVKLSHYLVRLDNNPEIQNGGDDVLFFVRDATVTSDSEWYYAPSTTLGGTTKAGANYGDYPEIRIKYIFGMDLSVDPNITVKGGRITISLPSAIKPQMPFDPETVTWSADLVAVEGTTYDATTNSFTTVFKRGNQPNEFSGLPSQLQVNFENLQGAPTTSGATIAATYTLDELFYDISGASYTPDPYQYYTNRIGGVQVVLTRVVALRLPAAKLTYSLNRVDNATGLNGSYILPGENLQPIVRQGNFLQELRQHTALFASVQNYPMSNTGIVVNSGGPSWITHIGTSSIPFKEFLTTGAQQMIPAIPITSQLIWSDIWGRVWAQPIRSVFTDVAPLPGPLLNFWMTSTYELLDPKTNTRYLQWQSDTDLVVRAQVKLFNGYSKYFDICGCEANAIYSGIQSSAPAGSKNQYINLQGYTQYYGNCLQTTGTVLEGQTISSSVMAQIKNAHFCVDNQTFYVGCNGIQNLPDMMRAPSTQPLTGKAWMYLPSVDSYYPSGYIDESSMWDLTHAYYDDTPYDKSFPWHFDNNLPNIDSGISKPLNIISFPIFRGFGYSINYSNTLTHSRFPGYAGWWSDNLQNKDSTLLAGQSKINEISVGQSDLVANSGNGWIDITTLTGTGGAATAALSNMYVCEFNRQRAAVTPNGKMAYLPNVVPNNVVPVDPTLTSTDPRLFSYSCNTSKPMATQANIAQYNNYLSTGSARDYLYFGSNLRGQAKEDINILYTVGPLPGSPTSGFEGLADVQDGGRFVYWNPGLGPNAFEIVDDGVTTVGAQRTDTIVSESVYPSAIDSFKSSVYHLITVSDPNEINRTWSLPLYANSYGYGDAQVEVTVGGAGGSTCILNPGDQTTVTVTFYNNAGFDWNMKVGAITDGASLGNFALSGNDLLNGITHTVQVPTAYNFMTVQIPTEWQSYITIQPSAMFAFTPPMVFDFTSNNVVTIEDGFQGNYYYNITISPNLPSSLRGRLHHFAVTLNASYFDAIAGKGDPTGLPNHDYTIAIPDIVIGIPSVDGKIWWTSGYAYQMQFSITLNSAFFVDDGTSTTKAGKSCASNTDTNGNCKNAAQILDSPTWIAKLATASSQLLNQQEALNSVWTNVVAQNNDPVQYTTKTANGQTVVTFSFPANGNRSVFPFTNPNPSLPDTALFNVLLRTYAPQIATGWQTASTSTAVTFKDDTNAQKTNANPTPYIIRVTGAWMEVTFSYQIFSFRGQIFDDQKLYVGDSGVIQSTVTLTNIGDEYAWYLSSLATMSGENFVSHKYFSESDRPFEVELSTFQSPSFELLTPGDSATFLTYTAFDSISHLDAIGELTWNIASQKRSLPIALNLVNDRLFMTYQTSTFSVANSSDLSAIVNQNIPTPFTVPISSGSRPSAVLSAKMGAGYALTLQLDISKLPNNVASSPDTNYLFYRMNLNFDTSSDPRLTWFYIGQTSTPSLADTVAPPAGVIPQVDYLVYVISVSGNSTYTLSNVYEYRPINMVALICGLVFGLLLLIALIILIGCLIRKYGVPRPPTIIRRVIRRKKAMADTTPQAASVATTPTPAPNNGPNPTTKRHVVNIDYLMTGAVRVVVKDGNPSAQVVVDETSQSPPADDEEDVVIEETIDGDDPCGWFTGLFKRRNDEL